MQIQRKTVRGHFYYYLVEAVRLDKPKVYSVLLGARILSKAMLEKKKAELQARIYDDLVGADRLYLSADRLIEAEKRRRQYEARMKRLTPGQREEKDEVDAVNFVYTTLSTEGVPVTREDADLAYRFAGKGARNVRDENLQVSLDMIKGLRQVRESQKGMDNDFVLRLHRTIMDSYAGKHPGRLRAKPAYIYLKSYDKAEEIGFRPPAPARVGPMLDGLVKWYNASMDKLNAIELAALLHLRFYAIHPFEDGNKRVSRLLLNKALHDKGYPLLNISRRTAPYFDALVKSVEKKNERPFVEFVLEEFLQACRKGRKK